MKVKFTAILWLFLVTILLGQTPVDSIIRDSGLTVTVVPDSIQVEVNILKPKVESINLFDTLKSYAHKKDSLLLTSKKRLILLELQQKEIKEQLEIIDTIKNEQFKKEIEY